MRRCAGEVREETALGREDSSGGGGGYEDQGGEEGVLCSNKFLRTHRISPASS